MVKVKMMNENLFAKLDNEFRALGELLKTRQDEKQSLLNEFDLELSRYKQGKLSENTLASSVKKSNLELAKLDKNIRDIMQKGLVLSKKMIGFIRDQKPIVYKVTESGVSGGGLKIKGKKKPIKKKAPVKKKVAIKKKVVKKKLK